MSDGVLARIDDMGGRIDELEARLVVLFFELLFFRRALFHLKPAKLCPLQKSVGELIQAASEEGKGR